MTKLEFLQATLDADDDADITITADNGAILDISDIDVSSDGIRIEIYAEVQ